MIQPFDGLTLYVHLLATIHDMHHSHTHTMPPNDGATPLRIFKSSQGEIPSPSSLILRIHQVIKVDRPSHDEQQSVGTARSDLLRLLTV